MSRPTALAPRMPTLGPAPHSWGATTSGPVPRRFVRPCLVSLAYGLHCSDTHCGNRRTPCHPQGPAAPLYARGLGVYRLTGQAQQRDRGRAARQTCQVQARPDGLCRWWWGEGRKIGSECDHRSAERAQRESSGARGLLWVEDAEATQGEEGG